MDLETGAIVSVTVQGADRGDTQTMVKTLTEAAENVEQALPEGQGIEEMAADKGYHSTERMVDLEAVGLRSYVSEPRRDGSGGMRRLHVRRRENVLKRLLIQVSAFNLGMLMR